VLTIGLDIGGANTKLALCEGKGPGATDGIELLHAESKYFPFWQEMNSYSTFIAKLLSPYAADLCVITTTAELADCFPGKRDGVNFVLSPFLEPHRSIRETKVFLSSGRLVSIQEGLSKPGLVAAANWLAPSLLVASKFDQAIFIDVGTTTTDIIPILRGAPAVSDPTDRGRLTNNQLVYTGSQRTNVATLVHHIRLSGQRIGVAAESFATTADVNLILGLLRPSEVSSPASDGGEISREGAMRRLSRVICCDLESLSTSEVIEMATFIHSAQVRRIADSISTLLAKNGLDTDTPCVLAGSGELALARPACEAAGMRSVLSFSAFLENNLSVHVRPPTSSSSNCAPAVSLAVLALSKEA